MVFKQEAAFETALINLLIERYGWEPELLRYKTEEDLIQNWKHILFENNRDVDRLNDVPLTDGEMQQILDQITRLDVYKRQTPGFQSEVYCSRLEVVCREHI